MVKLLVYGLSASPCGTYNDHLIKSHYSWGKHCCDLGAIHEQTRIMMVVKHGETCGEDGE